MKPRNAMQLKALINNYAKENCLSPQLVLQNYYLQRFLERLSVSRFKNNFVIKGGVLISTLLGLNKRTTMDIDATALNLPMNADALSDVVKEICSIEIDDDVEFRVVGVSHIADHNDYPGLRVDMLAVQPPMKTEISMDLTMGDSIVPEEIENVMQLMFEERSIQIMTYSLETLLAEKLQTILVRGVLNTRTRDYYDIFLMQKMRGSEIRCDIMREAFIGTCKKRDTEYLVYEGLGLLEIISNDQAMKQSWSNYQKKFDYAKDISFEDAIDAAQRLMKIVR